ncbi:interleukin-5 receptor subunit alpha-like [Eleutherodactylus coqui]|uniref:interleukin-5 receptor subunit alpha-like n=1 Tax=Eleutherodactylus coqui TaxID=57060 RepID=UPI0034620A82
MKIRISLIFLWIICQCFCLHLCCNLHEIKYNLEARNLSLRIRNKQAFLTWKCDVPIENFSNVSYYIYLKHEDWEFEKEENVCGKEIELSLQNHPLNPVCVQVVPALNNNVCQIVSEICTYPGGTQTAESIQCIVYDASSMNCTWTLGENISYKTEYTLSLKQNANVINCPQYINDLERKTGSCSFHDLTLDYFDDVTIILNRKGSEHYVLKEEFQPANKEIFNPPMNLTVTYTEENLRLSWRRPHTQYNIPESCFQYQVQRNQELLSDVKNPYSMSNLEKKCLIRVRARGDSSCGMNNNWGLWSEEISCAGPQKPDNTEIIILFILLGLSCFIILLTIMINIQYKRIIKFLFPRIPRPKINFDDIEA